MQKKYFRNIVFLILSFSLFLQTGAQNKLQISSEYENTLIRNGSVPLIKKVDVVIVGGSTAAVSAAVSAAKNGAKVFLVAPRPYLGEDMCATLRLKIDEKRILKTDVERQIFGDKLEVSPLKVKAVLDSSLIKANVEFVFGSFVSDILRDNNNEPAGVIINNRAGAQAVVAKTIIDATDGAWVCRMADVKMHGWNGSEINFERTVIMPEDGVKAAKSVTQLIPVQMPDFHFWSFAKAEQMAREKTYTEGQLRASESLFYTPQDWVVCKKGNNEWDEQSEIESEYFQTEKFDNLFVLNGYADLPRSVAESLLAPAAMAEAGSIVGLSAAKIASKKKLTTEFKTYDHSLENKFDGEIRKLANGLRPTDENLPKLTYSENKLQIISDYDIVVVGGGTSGAPAAIATARWGMKVLVVEYQEGLGGIGTLGLIGKPYNGQKVGFAKEVPFPDSNIEPKMEWYRSELKSAGADIWLGVLGYGAVVEGNRVNGVVVATPEGNVLVKSKVVIDATGNADIAIAAGASYMYGDIEKNDIALQGTGLSSRPLDGNYINSDYLLVDETDMTDVWRTLVSVQIAKNAENVYDLVPLIQNRERRRIIGDHVLNYLDQVAGRTYSDAIVYSGSDYDSHGYPSSPFFALLPHDVKSRGSNHPAPGGNCYTPYRCLLPKGLEGILVTGLGISMDRDASAMVRMQFDLANQGYAAGVAASLSVVSEKSLRKIDIHELQKHLVEIGNLPKSVLTQKDVTRGAKKNIEKAIADYGNSTNPENAGKSLAIILTNKETVLPLIRKKYKDTSGESKLLFAQVLAMCGINDGVPLLLDTLKHFSGWDKKIFQGFMADYAHLPTPLDGIILALGNSGEKSALPVLLKLVEELDQHVTLSHHRSLASALEKLGDPLAAKPLAELLKKEGMQGHAMLTLNDALTDISNDGRIANGKTPLEKRTKAIREITLARALYRCGDYEGIGENILKNYEKDMQGLFARHADSILNRK